VVDFLVLSSLEGSNAGAAEIDIVGIGGCAEITIGCGRGCSGQVRCLGRVTSETAIVRAAWCRSTFSVRSAIEGIGGVDDLTGLETRCLVSIAVVVLNTIIAGVGSISVLRAVHG